MTIWRTFLKGKRLTVLRSPPGAAAPPPPRSQQQAYMKANISSFHLELDTSAVLY